MKITETIYGIELTKAEIKLIVDALNYECEYEKEQIAELKESNNACDHAKWAEIDKVLRANKELRNEMGNLIGIRFCGN